MTAQTLPELIIGQNTDPDSLYEAFVAWTDRLEITLYPHQDEAIINILTGAHTIVTTPTGSGKSLIAAAAHFACWATGGRSYYTAPIKALVSEKFFSLVSIFGARNVGMVTGDAAVNAAAPIICCTAEILANIALRDGANAAVDQVVMDEFHFIAEPDRGWAWQVGLSELPRAQMVIMSATLGDVSDLADALQRRSGRSVAVVSGAERPVPLVFRWALTPVHETVEEIVTTHQSPVYIVHSSQGAALERAQSLLSLRLVSTEQRAEIVAALGHFRFAPGFGQTLSKMVRAGIGVHHAGLLPKYRRLVETLAQQGLLKVICGTDTLGVGINVPIRTVLFTQLSKFDGYRQRILKSREFHQIAGRAGRAGFDTVGHVVVQAPEHVIENEKALAKAGDDVKKRRRVQRKKAPDGFVNYSADTFDRLVASVPETLQARMRITPSMLLNLLQRDEDPAESVLRLIDTATEDRDVRRRLRRRAVGLARSLLHAGVIVRRESDSGIRYRLSDDLQDDFALNQPLSAFAMAAVELLDSESGDYQLDVLSIIEATLENPMPVLWQQQFLARGETVAELKADGFDYEERMEILEDVTWPEPLAELLRHAFNAWQPRHPWVSESDLKPKSVVRDMFERAMTFGEYVAFHKVQRSEGLLLRYLSDAYRALRQTVPDRARTDEFDDLVEWLGEVIRITDSSLLDEWEALTDPDRDAAVSSAAITDPSAARRLTANPRALEVMVRNAMFRLVTLIAADNLDALVESTRNDPQPAMTRERWDEALDGYFGEHNEVLLDSDARGPALRMIERTGRMWQVRQILHDPEDNLDWQLWATVDLDACDEEDQLTLHVADFKRID